ncbi:hypothetical protein [Legionella yabuuchiae]|uniref:hypothetical protein n=1 Tax=Legionella yabuuchiae TaxID=376727 RepID=UPI00105439FF|nr:hypothetical protein [Legionella yabuuchiae]
MFSLTKTLHRRERIGNNNELKAWWAKKTQKNIIHDSYASKKIVLDSAIIRNEHCDNLVVVLDEEKKLSLYDISRTRKLWSVQIENRQGYHSIIKGLKLSPEGLVLYISEYEDYQSTELFNHYLQVFFQGKKVGDFEINYERTDFSSFRLIERRIFAITNFYAEPRFQEWDTTGLIVRSISIDSMKVARWYSVDCNRNYYVIASRSPASRVNLDGVLIARHWEKIPFLVFNLTTNEISSFNIANENESAMTINSICLSGEQLICGIHTETIHQMSRDPKICIFNVRTGVKEYELNLEQEEGKIIKIIANERYIVLYLSYREYPYPHNFYCVDIHTKLIRRLPSLPHLDEFNCQKISHFFTDNFLTVCYPSDIHSYKRSVIDLDNGQEVQNVRYRGYHRDFTHPSFTKGMLLAPINSWSGFFNDHRNKTIYIEDFNLLTQDEKLELESSTRITPRL